MNTDQIILFFYEMFQLLKQYTFIVIFFYNDLVDVLHEYNGMNERDLDLLTIQEQEEPITIIPPKYEDKYLLEYYNIQMNEPLSEDKKESLCNNYVMEFSPVGNVIMSYDSTKSSFIYYSDSTVPFRYLEPIGRKFVNTFQCKELFQIMNTDIENKMEVINKPIKTKDILKGLQMAKQVKNRSVKINTNRYTSMGRLSNFKMCKAIDRTKVDKNYSISFSDFKKMNSNKTSL